MKTNTHERTENMTDITVDNLIAERIEKAGESYMIAQTHRDAGNPEVASGWVTAAEYAQATADHLSRLLIENERLSNHLKNGSECIGSCEDCSASIYEGDKYSTSIDGCHFCLEHSAMLSDCLEQMEYHLAEAGDDAYEEYECLDQAEFIADIVSLKHRIATDGDCTIASS